MIKEQDQYVYTVERKDGSKQHNYSTGTRVYTRKSNAEKLAKRYGGVVVTYRLVKVEES